MIEGLSPTTGASLWSAPPRERPMFTIVADTCATHDLMFPRCTGALFEYAWGIEDHSSCQDVLAEAEGQYGLTPDDVHDSFNFWMNTAVDESGRLVVERNVATADDHVELLAQMDVLAVVAPCSADVFSTSNFAFRSLSVAVRDATDRERDQWLLEPDRWLANQRTVDQFRVREIKASRELRRDPDYVPSWPSAPAATVEIPLELSEEQVRELDALRAEGELGSRDGEIVRFGFFTWLTSEFANFDPMARTSLDDDRTEH